ncbi:MAG TPA: hypothetical protein VFV53_02075 [Candidatus Limnocylindrales bacterium]|nr:hypothetical protein [Candidatus Limnocylindrales bacterium]
MRSVALVGVVVAVAALAGCDATPPTASPTAFALRPAVQIDGTWQASNGQWTFTGRVDPQGDPTDVVLDVGPGPATTRQFNQQIPVAQDLTEAGPLTITTRDMPDIDEICVRFTATNSAGTSSSTPLCVPHDLPSFVIDADPPTATFSAPASGSTTDLNVAIFTVEWTEADAGTGISRRSIQRRVATDSAGTCGAYEDDGPASAATSPLAVTDLVDGRCYEWVATLSDAAGNTSETTSGTVRVDIGT